MEGYIFEKWFYRLKILGWTFGFRATDDLPSVHWDETKFRNKHASETYKVWNIGIFCQEPSVRSIDIVYQVDIWATSWENLLYAICE